MSYGREPVTVERLMLYLIREKSILVGAPGCLEQERVWIPRSQILDTDFDLDDDRSVYDEGFIEIPQWLAEEKNLV